MIYSYTRINDWRNCPRQFNEVHVLKNYKKTFGPAAQAGIEKHKILENALKTGDFRGVSENFHRKTSELLTLLQFKGAEAEREAALTKDLRPVTFWSKDSKLWLRGKIDVCLPQNDTAIVIDWKTGNPKNHKDDLQAKIYGALLSQEFKKVACWIYFAIDGINFEYTIDTAEALAEVQNLIGAIDADEDYNPKPSGLCGYCPVTLCEYNK